MFKPFALAIALLVAISSKAQTAKPDSTVALDSAALLKEMMDLLEDTKPVSYVNVDVTLGNRLYSIRNKGLNAKQADASLLVYTPTVGYFHKSGLSLTAGANFLSDPKKGFHNSQTSLNAAWDLAGNKNLDAGLSYSHYFVADSYAPYASPVQNDWYGYVTYRKSWINPGLAAGYSTGYYNTERIVDTVINNVRRRLYDSATFNLKAFTLIASVSHQFKWTAVLGKEDELSFTPSLLVNFGSSTINISHNTNAIRLLNFLNKRGKLPKLSTTSFQAESAGLTLNLNYTVGRFSFEPQCYFDYYLPSGVDKRFTQVVTFTTAYSF